jgi:ABC-type polysaccharide/polyol phosphate export permease
MKQLTSNTILPKEVLVIGTVIANAIEFVIAMVICVLIAYWSGIKLSWAILFLPLVIILQLLMVMWVSLFLSCIFVFVKDIAHIYQVFLRILFFITPTFYTPDFLGGGPARYIVLLNPLAHLLSFSRSLIIEGRLFPGSPFLVLTFVNVILTVLGFLVFKRYEQRFAEYV